jgi:hypothetical protein
MMSMPAEPISPQVTPATRNAPEIQCRFINLAAHAGNQAGFVPHF